MTHNLDDLEQKTNDQQIDIAEIANSSNYQLSLAETDRLLFAKQVLTGIAVFCLTIVLLAAWMPDNKLIESLVDLIKIGALPLVTLIISFYFPQSRKGE